MSEEINFEELRIQRDRDLEKQVQKALSALAEEDRQDRIARITKGAGIIKRKPQIILVRRKVKGNKK